MSSENKKNPLGSLFALIIAVALVVGYIKGAVKLAKCDFRESYKAEVIYSIGFVTGTNSVLGYFDFGK